MKFKFWIILCANLRGVEYARVVAMLEGWPEGDGEDGEGEPQVQALEEERQF